VSKSLIAVSAVGFVYLTPVPALAIQCPDGKYPMITPNGTICVPYANGGPSKPGPGPDQSTITGPSGPGGGSSGGGGVKSAE
jgi:hypothetical protein